MHRYLRPVSAVLAATALGLVIAAPVGADTSGNETFNGVIVTSGTSGQRVVVNSIVRAKGAFNGVGRIVEVDNLPTDPDDVSRDDLVFPEGTIYIVSTTVDATFSLNPKSCLVSATLEQTGEIDGGTGQFAAASGTSTATVTARGILPRNPDGSCSDAGALLHEVDTIASSGTLSF